MNYMHHQVCALSAPASPASSPLSPSSQYFARLADDSDDLAAPRSRPQADLRPPGHHRATVYGPRRACRELGRPVTAAGRRTWPGRDYPRTSPQSWRRVTGAAAHRPPAHTPVPPPPWPQPGERVPVSVTLKKMATLLFAGQRP